jgi:hypothetical protein
MGIQQPKAIEQATGVHGNVGLWCALALTAVYWPFASSAMVTFHVLLGVPKEPFDANLAFVPTMMLMSSGFQSAYLSWSPEERKDWRLAVRVSLRLLPFTLLMGIVNVSAEFLLRMGWGTENRYMWVFCGSFLAGAICSACTYILWRLLVHPVLNSNHASSVS